MTICVTTPTGNVGRHLVRALVRAGVRPRLLLRDESRLEPDLRDLVEVAEGDQTDPEFVTAATRGATALYWVDALDPAHPDPLARYAEMTASVCAAVRANEVPRTVFQSSVGAEKRHGAGEIDGLAATEVALDAVAAGVVHLRCGYFFTNLLLDPDSLRAGVLATALTLDAPMHWVDPRDVAEVAAGWLLREDWAGRHVQAVHGPRALTTAEAAEVITEALGHEVAARQVADDDLHATLTGAGMTEAQADAIVGMSAGLREDFVPEQDRDATTTTPGELGPWAWQHLRPLVAAR